MRSGSIAFNIAPFLTHRDGRLCFKGFRRCSAEGSADDAPRERSWLTDAYKISQIDYSTGFPVPIHQELITERKKPTRKIQIPEKQETKEEFFTGDVSPVFRVSPFDAEEKRKKKGNQTAQILFLDEGNHFRSMLGAAILDQMIHQSNLQSDVVVVSASIGDVISFNDVTEIEEVVREIGLDMESILKSRSERVFDANNDPVNQDLLLVMDRFDHEEVYKEVAVLDTINPNGYYSTRLKLLGEFCRAVSGPVEALNLEIGDPFYGRKSAEERTNALKITTRKLVMGCQGLVTYLNMLKSRCFFDVCLQLALTQSLRCPVMEHSAIARTIRMSKWTPVWTTGSGGKFYTIKKVKGGTKVVRKSSSRRKKSGYWQDITNIESEIQNWMQKHNRSDRLPKHQELWNTGQHSLSVAVSLHGGMPAFESRLNTPSPSKKRKQKGYWDDIQNVEHELKEWMKENDCETFPTRSKLRATGHHALVEALRRHGGMEVLTRRLGIEGAQRRRSYWKSDENLKKELIPWLKENEDGRLYLPTQRELLEGQRADLVGAVLRRGGFSRVAMQFGWRTKKLHLRPFHDLAQDIQHFVLEQNLLSNVLPSSDLFKRLDRQDLVTEIRNHGGFKQVAQRLGWQYEI